MDFEYLKYDFRLFTNEISKWQITIDEQLIGTVELYNELPTKISGFFRVKWSHIS